MSTSPRQGVPDLRSRVLRGLVWVGASQVGFQLIRAAVAIMIARLLTPEEFGLAALALVFSSLVMVFSDMALGAALIQRRALTQADKSTAFWLAIASGTAFTAIGVLLAGPIAALYGEPKAEPLLLVLSSTFLIAALGSTHLNLMWRELDFRRTELIALGATIVGGGAGVVLAILGAGAWAIIAQQGLTTVATTLLLWIVSSWRPSFTFSRASLRDLGGFSANMLGQRICWYLQVNGDAFLIGRFLGTASLGIYRVAYNTILVPASKLGGPLQRVFSPAFSRIQDDPERIAATWARVARLIAAVSVPALAGLVVVAPDFVPLVLGEQWRASVPVVQVLAWVGIVQALQSLNMDVLMARDRTATMFRFSIILVTGHLIAFSVGLEWGVVGVAVAYAISTTLIEPFQTLLAARALGVSPMVFFRAVAGPFQAALGMCVAVLAVKLALDDAVPLVRLGVCILTGLVSYGALCLWRVPELTNEARALLRSRGRGAVAAVPQSA